MTSVVARSRLSWFLVLVVLALCVTALAIARAATDLPTGGSRDEVTQPPLGSRAPTVVMLRSAGPTGDECIGVAIRPSNNPHRIMRAHAPGTTFCLTAGVHRIVRPLRPQNGDTIAGLPGTVLNGSKLLTDWEPGPNGWVTDAFLPPEPSDHGVCLSEVPECTFTEDVFVDGVLLTRSASADQVGPGDFYADHATNTITLGDDPFGRVVEQAVAPSLVRSTSARVTVRDLVLEKAANEAQEAAVDGRTESPSSGPGWHIVHNLVRLNHGVGVGVSDQGVIRANQILDQGQLGVSVWGRDVLVRGNEIGRNGTAGYDPEWEAGGLKAWVTESAALVGNHVHDNAGPGLWSDGGCDETLYRRNLITDNWLAGIQHEISYDARILRNRILRNGQRHKGWAWEAGIQIQSSGGLGLILVAHNVVVDNANGITVMESGDRQTETPAPKGPHIVRNILIQHNTVTMRSGQLTGLFQDIGNHSVFRRGIRFIANTYRLDSRGQWSFAWKDELVTWADWRGLGLDRGGSLVVNESLRGRARR